MADSPLQRPVPLTLDHDCGEFNCDSELGKGLLKDALLRTLQAADIAGLRAVVVHAKDDAARVFYERFGFVRSPLDDYHLMLLLKDLRKIVTG